MNYRCDSCNRFFPTSSALQRHVTSSIHSPRPYCETCIEWFPNQTLLEHHIATSHRAPTPPTYNCEQCSLTFGTPGELEEHTQSSIFHRYTAGRYYCDDCVLWFSDQDSLNRHLTDAEEHASHFGCVECGREFNGRRELEAHVLMGVLCRYGVGEEDTIKDDESVDLGDAASETYTWASSQWASSQASPAFTPGLGRSSYSYTYNSSRGVGTPHQLGHTGPTAHAESSQQGYRNFGAGTTSLQQTQQTYHCLGQTCLRTFASPSALLQHLDSGACPSGINRHIVNSATISLDHSSAITNRLLRAAAGRNIHEITPDEDEDEEETSIASKYLAQRSRSGPLPMGRPQLPWGLQSMDQLPGLSCPLCPRSSRPFRTATALHAHMTSPVHDARIYHCSTTGGGLGKPAGVHASRNFSTLGALAQHLESMGCAMRVPAGARIFNETVRNVKERLRQVELENFDGGGGGGGVRLQGLEWD